MADLNSMSLEELQALRARVASEPAVRGQKAAPASYIGLEVGEKEGIQFAYKIAEDLKRYEESIGSGRLKLNPLKNLEYKVKNAVGASDPASRDFVSFKAYLERMRNDSLRLNKGPQTEGDAARAWNELLSNINDGGVVTQRLKELRAQNEREARLKLRTLNEARRQANMRPFSLEDIVGSEKGITAPSAARTGKVVIDVYGRPVQ